MAKRVSGWLSEDGNIYTSEEEALEADKFHKNTRKVKAILDDLGVPTALPTRLLAEKILKELEK